MHRTTHDMNKQETTHYDMNKQKKRDGNTVEIPLKYLLIKTTILHDDDVRFPLNF